MSVQPAHAHPTGTRASVPVFHEERLKEAAIDVIALPAVVLLLIAIGDLLTRGGADATQHIVELTPFVVLAALAWRFPHAIGTLLVMVGVAAAVTYLATIAAPAPFAILTDVIAFLPPIVAGLLLLMDARA